MDKNVDQCSAVECIAAHPRLIKSPEEEEKIVYVFFCIGASVERFGVSHMRDFFTCTLVEAVILGLYNKGWTSVLPILSK